MKNMKRAEKIENLPKELLTLLKTEFEYDDDENFEDCEEIYDYILDSMGYGNDPKKKGKYYIGKSGVMKIGKYKVVAQYKQYIKEYDCVCDSEFDCILYE